MGFLSKHYEKIVLAAFLLIFIVALVYLIMVFSKSTEITEKDLTLVKRSADYEGKFDEVGKETKKGKEREYAHLENLGKAQSWTTTAKRNPNSPVETDLMKPISAARCPKCEKIIPSIYFDKEDKCILCGHDLKPVIIEKEDENFDVDQDGMDDRWERQYELNSESPSDKLEDADEDGYPNLIEHDYDKEHKKDAKKNAKPNDETSHPPLAWRLALLGVKRTQIPMQLYNVMKNNSEDPQKWLVQIKVKDRRGKWKSEFKKLNQEIKVGNDRYKILDVKYKEEEKYNPKLKQPMKMNTSEIIIQSTVKKDDKPIKVQMKKAVYENLVKIGLEDVVSEKRYSVKEGDTFTAGDELIGREKFKVLKLDGKKSVTIQDVTDGKKGAEYVIKKTSLLDQKINAVTEEDEKKAAAAQDEEPGAPGRNTRRRRNSMPPGMMPPDYPSKKRKKSRFEQPRF